MTAGTVNTQCIIITMTYSNDKVRAQTVLSEKADRASDTVRLKTPQVK